MIKEIDPYTILITIITLYYLAKVAHGIGKKTLAKTKRRSFITDKEMCLGIQICTYVQINPMYTAPADQKDSIRTRE